METYDHIPVLLNEVIEYLDPRPGQNIVDATLGGGGYTAAIIYRIKPDGKVLAIDLDADAIENVKGQMSKVKCLTLAQGNFAHVDKIVKHHNFPAPNGIVADLGLSSYELKHRGISFQTDQPLDMRFDLSQPLDAKFILNNYNQKRLEKIFSEYGEEKFSRQIVRKVIGLRAKDVEIKHTAQLYQIIQEALPKPVKHKADQSARRIFQALRIEVNHELENLREFLPKAFDLLAKEGRLVVVSFHSLEDRIVKQFFVKLTKGCVCPPEFPQCLCGKNPKGKILTKKPVTALAEELNKNFRSNPAKLRAIQKI
jgi:16S rRNA (cytosine1402-N4)-methyltransferase